MNAPLMPAVRPLGFIMRTYDDWKTDPGDDDRTPSSPATDPEHWRACPKCARQNYFVRVAGAVYRCTNGCPQPAPVSDPAMPADARKLGDAARALAFVLGGHAVFTLRNVASGNRLTYKVERAEPREGAAPESAPWFVAVLTGPQNDSDYSFLGTIFEGKRFAHGKRSRIAPDAPSARVFAAVFAALASGRVPKGVEVWHAGRCCKCGRTLTTPESIESGIGPVCAKRVG